MNEYLQDVKRCIENSDLVVVGLGEEWNISTAAKKDIRYQRIINDLNNAEDYRWILPHVYSVLTDEVLQQAYDNLFQLLKDKNYYVVATTVNRSFIPYVKDGRAVMPCGSDLCLQDKNLTVCRDSLVGKAFVESMEAYIKGDIELEEIDFARDQDGSIIPFNCVYAVNYKEDGYLPDWNKYMKWLQGTMNRKTCLLELGAGLQFPSVFRFPFEKMTYFNQKAFCFRVHESLYHVTEEMVERSRSIPMNSVELFVK